MRVQAPLKTFSFGDFRLEIHPHPQNDPKGFPHLLKGGKFEKLTPKRMELLRLFLEREPGQPLPTTLIHSALWPEKEDGGNEVVNLIEQLRDSLGCDAKNPKYIENLRNQKAYRFIMPVTIVSSGNLQVKAFAEWDGPRVATILQNVWPAHHEDKEKDELDGDIRIISTSLVPMAADFKYRSLLANGVRFRIILIDPHKDNDPLMHARYDLKPRGEYDYPWATKAIPEHLQELDKIRKAFPDTALQFKVSRYIPILLYHTSEWAALGMWPMQGGYHLSPMIECRKHEPLWEMLYREWRVRWEAIKEQWWPET